MYITTDNPCFEEIIVTLDALYEYEKEKIEIEPNTLTFSKGESSVNYTLIVASDYD